MFKYSQIESALMQGIPDKYQSAIRSRLKYLQRLGVLPVSPGKGAKIKYDLESVCKLQLCLQLAEFAIDPVRIVSTVNFLWSTIWTDIRDGNDTDVFLISTPAALSREAIEKVEGRENMPFLFPPGDMSGGWTYQMATLDLRHITERALIINLSGMRQRVVKALAETAKPERKQQ